MSDSETDISLISASSEGRRYGIRGPHPFKVALSGGKYIVTDSLEKHLAFSYDVVVFNTEKEARNVSRALNASARFSDIKKYLSDARIGQSIFLNNYPQDPIIADPFLKAKLDSRAREEDRLLLMQLMDSSWSSLYRGWINTACEAVKVDQLLTQQGFTSSDGSKISGSEISAKLRYFFYTYLVEKNGKILITILKQIDESQLDSVSLSEHLIWSLKKQRSAQYISADDREKYYEPLIAVFHEISKIRKTWISQRKKEIPIGRLRAR